MCIYLINCNRQFLVHMLSPMELRVSVMLPHRKDINFESQFVKVMLYLCHIFVGLSVISLSHKTVHFNSPPTPRKLCICFCIIIVPVIGLCYGIRSKPFNYRSSEKTLDFLFHLVSVLVMQIPPKNYR